MRNPAPAGSRAGPGQHKEGEADSTASAAPLQVQPLTCPDCGRPVADRTPRCPPCRRCQAAPRS